MSQLNSFIFQRNTFIVTMVAILLKGIHTAFAFAHHTAVRSVCATCLNVMTSSFNEVPSLWKNALLVLDRMRVAFLLPGYNHRKLFLLWSWTQPSRRISHSISIIQDNATQPFFTILPWSTQRPRRSLMNIATMSLNQPLLLRSRVSLFRIPLSLIND